MKHVFAFTVFLITVALFGCGDTMHNLTGGERIDSYCNAFLQGRDAKAFSKIVGNSYFDPTGDGDYRYNKYGLFGHITVKNNIITGMQGNFDLTTHKQGYDKHPEKYVCQTLFMDTTKERLESFLDIKCLSVNTDNLPKGDKSACKLKKSLETPLLFLIPDRQLPELVQP